MKLSTEAIRFLIKTGKEFDVPNSFIAEKELADLEANQILVRCKDCVSKNCPIVGAVDDSMYCGYGELKNKTEA